VTLLQRVAVRVNFEVEGGGAFPDFVAGQLGAPIKLGAGAALEAGIVFEAEPPDRGNGLTVVIRQAELFKGKAGCPIVVIPDLHIRWVHRYLGVSHAVARRYL